MESRSADGYVRLLVADPDLGAGLGAAKLPIAEQMLVAGSVVLERGQSWSPPSEVVEGCDAAALLVLDGWLFRGVTVAGVSAGELLGPGDLCSVAVDGADGSAVLRATAAWQPLGQCRLAIIDSAFLARAERWPPVLAALAGRALARAEHLARQSAITNRHRVDQRILLMFAHLARRHGRVTPQGIRVDVPLTHELLAHLVGAHRPTVSSALSELGRRDRLVRLARESWLLRRAVAAEDPPPGSVSWLTPSLRLVTGSGGEAGA